jgi:hypothetical protein
LEIIGASAHVAAEFDGVAGAWSVSHWRALLDMAMYNGVTSYVHAGLSVQSEPGAENEAVLRYLRERAFRSTYRNLALRAELVRLLRAFEDEGIAVIPIKGPLLADRYYRQPALREFGDLDLLVSEADRERAWQLLLRLNYHSPYQNSHLQNRYHVVFRHRDSEEVVELHWRIAGPQFGVYYRGGFLWEGAHRVLYLGTNVLQPTIEANLLYLAIHAYKHDWARLQWLLDFPELLASAEGVDWNVLDRLAREQHAHRLLRATLQLVQHFFPDQSGVPAGHALATPALGKSQIRRVVRLLAGPVSDTETLRNFYALRVAMADSAMDRLRLVLDSLKPSDRDQELLRLPPALRPFSIFLRPIRLASRMLLGRSREAERRQP